MGHVEDATEDGMSGERIGKPYSSPRTPEAYVRLERERPDEIVTTFVYGREKDGVGEIVSCLSRLEYQTLICAIYRQDFLRMQGRVGPFIYWEEGRHGQELTLDFIITDITGGKTAYVVCPLPVDDAPANFMEVMHALREAVIPCHADRLLVVMPGDIDPVEFYNAELMHAARRRDGDDMQMEAENALRRILEVIPGPISIRELVDRIDISNRGLHAVVRALRSGCLAWDRREKIMPDTIVRLGRPVIGRMI